MVTREAGGGGGYDEQPGKAKEEGKTGSSRGMQKGVRPTGVQSRQEVLT